MRWTSDWSSDVCSSDLLRVLRLDRIDDIGGREVEAVQALGVEPDAHRVVELPEEPRLADAGHARSEERRVGKECRSGWSRGRERRKVVKCGSSEWRET